MSEVCDVCGTPLMVHAPASKDSPRPQPFCPACKMSTYVASEERLRWARRFGAWADRVSSRGLYYSIDPVAFMRRIAKALEANEPDEFKGDC